MEAFRIAVRMTNDAGRDSDGGGPEDAPDGLPALALAGTGGSGGGLGPGGLGAGELQGVGAGGTGLEAGPLGGGAGPLALALPGLSGGAGGGRGALSGLGLAGGSGGPLDAGLAARLAGAGLLSGNGPCRTGKRGYEGTCRDAPVPCT